MKDQVRQFIIFVALSISAVVYGDSFTGTVSVAIATTFQYTELSIVNFHAIPANDGVCSMSKQGNLSGQCAGSPDGQIGTMRIEGTPKQWIDISVAATSPVDGVLFNPLLAANNSNFMSKKFNNSGAMEFDVIGSLTITNATPGLKALTYVLTVNYQ